MFGLTTILAIVAAAATGLCVFKLFASDAGLDQHQLWLSAGMVSGTLLVWLLARVAGEIRHRRELRELEQR